MEGLSLHNILDAFNNPLNEEQAWAICYQCARFLQNQWQQSPAECRLFGGLHAVELAKDGSVLAIRGADELAASEYELVQSLGVVIFQALDYGLSDTEEQKLTPVLEQLIEQMTGSDTDDDNPTNTKIDKHDDNASLVDDEGIEHDAEDGDIKGDIDGDGVGNSHGLSLAGVVEMCQSHCQVSMDIAGHYKAVCRAVFAEAKELSTFLEKISADKVHLKMDVNDAEEANLEELKRADWARLWMQVMRELRYGVKLKKLEHLELEQPREFELTPYEMLMEDISSRRYTLNKVVVNGDLPPRTKKDAHAVILEFIRSRPPLHPMKDRKLAPAPPKVPLPRELMLEDIRSEPRLNPTPGRHNIQSRLDEADGSPAKVKKVIRPDPSLFTFDEDDDEEEEDDDIDVDVDANAVPDKNKVEPLSPMSPFSPLSPKTPPLEGEPAPQPKGKREASTVHAFDGHRHSNHAVMPSHRHGNQSSIHALHHAPYRSPHPVSHTPSPSQLQSSLECLSLTVDEVMHIRRVLTKAELESLLVDLPLHQLVARAKICFTCKKTRFSLFQWSTKCAFCSRYVCSKCVSKMHIPTEHFEHIPVYTLSPSPSSPDSDPDLFMFQKTGSVPSSPKTRRSSTDMILSVPSIDNGNTAINHNGCNTNRGFRAGGIGNGNRSRPFRPPMQRAQTLVQHDAPLPTSMFPRAIQGPMKRICKDCKAMIVNIIRASRLSLATAPSLVGEKAYVSQPSPRKASRNFHLDLKPVYRTSPKK